MAIFEFFEFRLNFCLWRVKMAEISKFWGSKIFFRLQNVPKMPVFKQLVPPSRIFREKIQIFQILWFFDLWNPIFSFWLVHFKISKLSIFPRDFWLIGYLMDPLRRDVFIFVDMPILSVTYLKEHKCAGCYYRYELV